MFKITRKTGIWLGWLIIVILGITMGILDSFFDLSKGNTKTAAYIIVSIGVISGGTLWAVINYLPFPFNMIRKISKKPKTRAP